MNKLFLYLIIMGILFLVIVAGWEFFQISTGARTTFELTVSELPSTVLMPQELEDHLKQDPSFLLQQQVETIQDQDQGQGFL